MKVTSKGQITIPKHVREEMGIEPAKSEVYFVRDEQGRWLLSKQEVSRFRMAYKSGKPLMSTEDILALTRA